MTRIAVVSDTHGNRESLRKFLRAMGPFDRMFHLGDGVEDGHNAAVEVEIPFTGISGNEDQGSAFPRKLAVSLNGLEFILIHGDQFDITPYHSGAVLEGIYDAMVSMTQVEGADILLFGHTHKPLLTERKNIILCNPGDHYIGSSAAPTSAVIELDDRILSVKIFREAEGDYKEIESLRRGR